VASSCRTSRGGVPNAVSGLLNPTSIRFACGVYVPSFVEEYLDRSRPGRKSWRQSTCLDHCGHGKGGRARLAAKTHRARRRSTKLLICVRIRLSTAPVIRSGLGAATGFVPRKRKTHQAGRLFHDGRIVFDLAGFHAAQAGEPAGLISALPTRSYHAISVTRSGAPTSGNQTGCCTKADAQRVAADINLNAIARRR
jgi:hypothetical protein